MSMTTILPQLGDLIEMRLLLVRNLAESLEASQYALVHNDAEMIARGAARQAELCRQWSELEDQLRRESPRHSAVKATDNLNEEQRSAQIKCEFGNLVARIRYLTRVH